MKSFLLLLLNIVAATAASPKLSASDECKIQRRILEETIEHVNGMKEMKSRPVFIGNVITPKNCSLEHFCKAAEVLSALEAENIGLKEKDWLLPRNLIAYSRNTYCSVESPANQVELLQLLENIKLCAQKEYKKPCDKMKHST